MRKIIFGIRNSILATAQLDEFLYYLIKNGVKIESEVRRVKTKGDRDQVQTIGNLGQGAFVKELEKELVAGNIDCAFHSLKDMPVDISQGTILACIPPRADERDCIVCGDNISIENFKGISVATGSPRRTAFIIEQKPEIKVLPLRGNLDTRLRKLKEKEFDAMIVAACGLKRIGHEDRISGYLDPDIFVPAAGQGATCAQIRQEDIELNRLLKPVSCSITEKAVTCERKVLKELGIGCQTAFGVFARFYSDIFVVTAKTGKGQEAAAYHKQEGPSRDYVKITEELIKEIKVGS